MSIIFFSFGSRSTAEFLRSEFSTKSGDDLEVHYRRTLENLDKEPGLVGIIFRQAQNKISPPSLKLRRAGTPSNPALPGLR